MLSESINTGHYLENITLPALSDAMTAATARNLCQMMWCHDPETNKGNAMFLAI